MKRYLLITALTGFILQASHASLMVNWEFNESVGTALLSTVNNGTLSGTWQQNTTNVATDGSGNLVTSGTTPDINAAATTNKQGLGITANSGIYDMIFSDVRFSNPSGNDYLVFGFRTTQTGSFASSSRERANFKVGDFDGTTGLDLEATVTPVTPLAGSALYNVTTDFSGSFNFVLRLDTGLNLATAFFDAGSGLVQVGSAYSVDTGTTIDTIALRLIVSDAGAGDSISIGNISVVAVPEPATYGALFGALALVFVMLRRRRG